MSRENYDQKQAGGIFELLLEGRIKTPWPGFHYGLLAETFIIKPLTSCTTQIKFKLDPKKTLNSSFQSNSLSWICLPGTSKKIVPKKPYYVVKSKTYAKKSQKKMEFFVFVVI